jgi:Fe-S cluster biogenesis protein NfuA
MSELNIENVEFVLEKIRPYLKIDGGNVELVKIKKDDGIVEVCLTGACKECPLRMMTLRAGIERALMKESPDVKRIESVVM